MARLIVVPCPTARHTVTLHTSTGIHCLLVCASGHAAAAKPRTLKSVLTTTWSWNSRAWPAPPGREAWPAAAETADGRRLGKSATRHMRCALREGPCRSCWSLATFACRTSGFTCWARERTDTLEQSVLEPYLSQKASRMDTFVPATWKAEPVTHGTFLGPRGQELRQPR